MSVQLQLRHDTATNWASVTPAQGEAVTDNTFNVLRLGDGTTAGGWRHGLETRTSVLDIPYTVLVTDRIVAYTSLSASRAVTLPAASAYPTGARLTIIDETGNCSPLVTITVARAGSDTISGLTAAVIASAYASLTLESNGSNAWGVVTNNSPQASLIAAQGVYGSFLKLNVLEQLVSGLTGASVIAGTQIPANSIVLGCAERVNTAITGATSFSVGYTGSTSAFGSSLSTAFGATNFGMIGPLPIYSATNIVLTAAGSNFTAGAVRLALFYASFGVPTS